MYIETNGVRLYAEISGQGKDLFLLHGNGEDHTIFDEAAHILEKKYRVWRIDSRGHGKSSPCEEYHYRDMARDILLLLEQKDMQNVLLYGFSDGGIVALLCAMETNRIDKLAISGANLSPKGIEEDILQMMKEEYRETRDPKIRMMLTEPDITKQDLRKISIPVLVIAGEYDVIRKEETQRIASWLKNSRLLILEGEDHDSYITHQTKIADILLKNLEESVQDI